MATKKPSNVTKISFMAKGKPGSVAKLNYIDDKYVDAKIKPIKREIQQLKVALNAMPKQYAQELLEVQRAIAGLKINSDVAVFRTIIESNFPQKTHLFTRLVNDAAAEKSKLRSSKTPNVLSINFYKKWSALLKDLGADIAEF
jgi:hypothetical protein